MSDLPAWGELWWCEFRDIGRRPALVLSRDVAIQRRQRCMVAPCTTTLRRLPSEVVLHPGEDPVPSTTAINLDSIESVGMGAFVQRIGRLSPERLHAVCEAASVAMNCLGSS